ncbi:hypothetical protein PHMEG_00030605 [Phytophthora megakarya]|uniref:Uncharacterized protein n=1 Tax=Phytophthora megakarya TaxID=4795 RepID=A0A225UZZ3_9STRA|nr:hypothetical protein PHMEG_00030605 [Phytophthora megakarya]
MEKRVRCRTTFPCESHFLTNTHLLVRTFWSFGRSTNFHVLFLIRSLYSFSNDSLHLSESGEFKVSSNVCGSIRKFTASTTRLAGS